jgi:group I intron endonuclease
MFYYLYKITNLVNNKIYVGVHKTRNLNDGYMGSGKVILSAIEKYGKQNFVKEILEYFDTASDMFSRENEIVNEEFLKRDDVYNLRKGGSGGFDYINSSGIIKFKGKKHSSESKKTMGFKNPSIEERKMMSDRMKGNKHNPNLQKKGKQHPASYPKSDEHKEKLKEIGKKQTYEQVVCPHCNKNGNKNIMIRWHFDNCKMRDWLIG